ncbi:CopA family copper-resistance protein [Mucilaginibacter frigoritolerans]|uniref:CopA family copper-resistance protein n=1 Tax=Mucilaginibacter frigoritolerans TaxID=652788 RepID=A0A562TNA7_9SPHI|nr:multicopper oxidase domain-containing protein [Mucilaginibacter frigoritolerans]TWI95059.1 CopA family copper-resistance protein [Mucilaginibacter frigoritolerans]
MKTTVLILWGLLIAGAAFPQHMPMNMEKSQKEQHLPFYTKIGNREIYHLYIGDTIVNYTGKKRPAMAINGSIPAPALEFTEGDTAEIYIHNEMMMETSIHWHGVILPNRYDGVSYLTTAPIKPGETHFYKFPLVQHGTLWYHSHTMTQQQSGIYGAFIIHPKQQIAQKEYTLLLSDWTDENPEQVERSLHNQTDWYAIKKGSTQNYAEAISKGYLGTKLTNEWKRMIAMDVSDVYYDRFLSNGSPQQQASQFKAGDKVTLHVINGSSSAYFWLNYAGGKITVVASDGQAVEPVKVDRMIIAVAETYDVEVTVPKDGSFEFLATAEDRSGSTSLWLGDGAKVKAKPLPKLQYFEGMKMMNGMMTMSGNRQKMDGMQMSNQKMDMNRVMYPEITEDTASSMKKTMDTVGKKMDSMAATYMSGMDMGATDMTTSGDLVTLNYGMLKAPHPTTLPPGPVKVFTFNLTGNMNRYVWTINNKTVSESDKILIKKGENVRIILYNNTMMRHPMHLHGHYFRVLNGQGEYAPLKNTLDIMPMETDTIEFAATASGDWFFHCHILYHMMSGMGRIFSYENSPKNPEIPDSTKAIKKVYADDQRFFPTAKIGLESNGSDGNISLVNTRWKIQTLWKLGTTDEKGYESETIVGRYLGQMQWLYAYAGFDYQYRKVNGPEKNLFGQISNQNNRHTVVAGLAYALPLLFVADARIDGNGKLRLQLGRDDIPVTSRLRFSLMGNTDKEYNAGLRYIITKYFSISGHYDSDMGLGAGLTILY